MDSGSGVWPHLRRVLAYQHPPHLQVGDAHTHTCHSCTHTQARMPSLHAHMHKCCLCTRTHTHACHLCTGPRMPSLHAHAHTHTHAHAHVPSLHTRTPTRAISARTHMCYPCTHQVALTPYSLHEGRHAPQRLYSTTPVWPTPPHHPRSPGLKARVRARLHSLVTGLGLCRTLSSTTQGSRQVQAAAGKAGERVWWGTRCAVCACVHW